MAWQAGRIPLVAGNWKMNTTVTEGVALTRQVLDQGLPGDIEVAILPPFTHLVPVRDVIAGGAVLLGAQDCFWEAAGAYTGEISPRTLAEICELVLVGHSERRRLLDESEEAVGRKLRAALAEGLRVIVAVGETLEEREAGDAETVVHAHLAAAFEGVDAGGAARCVVAYEPVWAIGTGRTASARDAQSMCAAIRGYMSSLAGADVAAGMRILYGGSMTADNAAELLAEADIDGGLIGGASLKPAQFAAIAAAASAARSTQGS